MFSLLHKGELVADYPTFPEAFEALCVHPGCVLARGEEVVGEATVWPTGFTAGGYSVILKFSPTRRVQYGFSSYVTAVITFRCLVKTLYVAQREVKYELWWQEGVEETLLIRGRVPAVEAAALAKAAA